MQHAVRYVEAGLQSLTQAQSGAGADDQGPAASAADTGRVLLLD